MSTEEKQEFSLESIIGRIMLIEETDKPADIARALKVSSSLFTNWKRRGTMPYKQLLSYASRKKLSYEWLMKGEGSKKLPRVMLHDVVEQDEIKDAPENYTEFGANPFKEGFEQISFLDVEAAITGEIRADDNMETHPFSKERLANMGLTKNEVYYTRLESDAMSPTMLDDDIDTLLIDPSDKNIKDTFVYAIAISGELLHRRLHKTVGGGVKITSDNPLYPDIDLSKEQTEQMQIVGRVRFKIRIEEI